MSGQQQSNSDAVPLAKALRILEELAGNPDVEALLVKHPDLTQGDVTAALLRARKLLLREGGRDAARERRFRRMLSVARRNPDVDGDALLDELEREDAARRARASA
jgi:hypothetical protein